jgi:hypothetical protein
MKKDGMFRSMPCEKCLTKLVNSDSKFKVKDNDMMISKELCPSCRSAASALLGLVNWLHENINEHRLSVFKVRDDGRFVEFKIGGFYMKFDSSVFDEGENDKKLN